TGGVTADAFPPAEALLRFLRGCVEAGVPFKATAGLHHPVTGEYPLTYEADSPRGWMYGYLNLVFATALVRRGAPDGRVLDVLRETDAASFQLGEYFAAWREFSLGRDEIEVLRERGLV